MSWSNEELIEELMWEAHEKGLGSELIDLASAIQSNEKLDRAESFQRAYNELKIGEINIAKFQKKPNGSKVMVCNKCDKPLKEYWKMNDDEKMAADRQITIPAQYCENCKTKI